uniref:Core-2/I-branching beta-1,6-N-acetylglucosaminyltransferase family protein n=1 Tax=Kalanchoe fedtschenkoi TaxID=63787 RepID=A0A7N0SWG9_KALFE
MVRGRGEKEEGGGGVLVEKHLGLLKLVKILSVVVVFVAGVVIGLGTTSHINLHFMRQADLYFYADNVSAAVAPSVAGPVNCTLIEANCESVDCLGMDRFVKPPGLKHSLSDRELFWRASMEPRVKRYPFARVPKVAFMFLTRGPLPLLPLWERFFEGQDRNLYTIYVHANPGFDLNVSSSSVFYGRQIPSQNVEWGTATLTDAEKRLLANALLDFSNERFVLLSESCIPVHNFPTVYKYLIHSKHSFADAYDEPTRYGRGRYNRKMFPDIHLRQWRKGSQWFELNRYLAISVISDTKYYEIFKKYCKPACYPDEHYIPTLLNMFYGSQNANRSVTWVDWSLGGPHPATYENVNITEGFIRHIRNNKTLCSYNSEKTSLCYLFARKFAPSALEPLLNLTSIVMRF